MKKPSQQILPTIRQTTILRRAAKDGILCTMIKGEPNFCYADGSEITGTYNDVLRCIKNGWLIGDGRYLFDIGFSQKYMPRKPS